MFIIVGIAIVFAVGVFIFLVSRGSDYVSYIPGSGIEAVDDVYFSMDECLKDSANYVIAWSSFNGGYYFNEDSAYYDNLDVIGDGRWGDIFDNGYAPFYFKQGIGKSVPSLDILEMEFSKIYFEYVSECLFSLESLESNYEVTYDLEKISEFNIQTKIDESKITFIFDVPIIVDYLGSKYLIKDFSIEEKSNYYRLYNTAKKISEIQESYGEFICLTCVLDVSGENEVYISTSENFLDSRNYVVIYNLEKFEDEKEVFRFAHLFYNE